ncbi:putative heat shock protein [Trypanosoma rangeli]|uniref:Putative heat shock protein n=1 Tax=Trypanosoma rangeli TaxID=5698 RepID=A0A422NGH8_TRYRA|nr:putative heat shock protein [Trypanosoma rangeli]RNF04571.1 putative heat shock protein [Trypanosoma rangeli]|eukprot:RNF04571.1 putative heat shock protein [Trypanosoma rangeli]
MFRVASLGPLLAAPRTAMTTATRLLHTTLLVRDGGRGNFFAYLGLQLNPELNVAEVQHAYHNLQRRVHPDQTNVQAKEVEQEQQRQQQQQQSGATPVQALEREKNVAAGGVADADESKYANVAYETLRDPFLRCKYLARLSRAGKVKGALLTPAEEEALMDNDDCRNMEENRKLMGGGAGDPVSLSSAFLEEMMAVNETIFSSDGSQEEGKARLQLLVAHLEERYDEFYDQAKTHWKQKDLHRFHHCVVEWTYIRNALQHAKRRLD